MWVDKWRFVVARANLTRMVIFFVFVRMTYKQTGHKLNRTKKHCNRSREGQINHYSSHACIFCLAYILFQGVASPKQIL
ncbi:hypothetical protein V1509DRAFT_617843 [Lipomyces kononenkoae]